MLKSKTVKGKNRIQRGGSIWKVYKTDIDTRTNKFKLLMQSIRNEKEMFWMDSINDSNIEVISQ